MRKIEMRRIDGQSPPVIEIVGGRRYLAVMTMPEGATGEQRMRARAELQRVSPGYVAAIVIPHGYMVDVYEDDAPPTQDNEAIEA